MCVCVSVCVFSCIYIFCVCYIQMRKRRSSMMSNCISLNWEVSLKFALYVKPLIINVSEEKKVFFQLHSRRARDATLK